MLPSDDVARTPNGAHTPASNLRKKLIALGYDLSSPLCAATHVGTRRACGPEPALRFHSRPRSRVVRIHDIARIMLPTFDRERAKVLLVRQRGKARPHRCRRPYRRPDPP